MSRLWSYLYRALIDLHPREFRDLYGDDLLQTVRLREADRVGLSAPARLLGRLRELSALGRSAVSLRSRSKDASRVRMKRRFVGLSSVAGDVGYALRGFRLAPGFTVIVVLTLGLGIGANSAIFTLLDQLMLRPLPVRDPGALVSLDAPGAWSGWQMGDARFSYPFYLEIREQTDAFEGVLARYVGSASLEHGGESERIDAVIVSGNYFDVLGVAAHRGRLLSEEDDALKGAHPVVVLSHRYWLGRFGGDDSIVGESVRVNAQVMEIVGVAAPGFDGIEVGVAPDLFVTLAMKDALTPTWDEMDNRRTRFLHLIARLRDGGGEAALHQAEAVTDVVFREISERDLATMTGVSDRFLESFGRRRLELHPAAQGISELRERFSTPLVVLMGMVGLVLLTACANVANLLLARGAGRHKDVALRLALGASRWRIVRQLVVESVLLASAGGVVGLVLAVWTAHALVGALPFEGAAATLSAEPDGRVLGFTLWVSVLTGIVFGLTPALKVSSPSPASTLKDGNVASALPQARLRKSLVVSQVALSLLLLIGAALFSTSLRNLESSELGFRPERLLTFSVDPSTAGYSQSRMATFFDTVRTDLGAVPGVDSVSMAEISAVSEDRWMSTIQVEGYEPTDDEDMNPDFNGIGPEYFQTMGIPLLAGREFTERDTKDAPKVAVVNETMARYFFGDESPIGRRFGFGSRERKYDIEIVGLVGNSKYATLREEPPRFGYIPVAQNELLSEMTFYVRTALPEESIVTAARGVVREHDPSLPIFAVKSMRTQLSEAMFVERLVAALATAFGVLASLLAAIGLYGVMSLTVARRTREIGIRMAFGARRDNVVGLVLKEVLSLAGWGVIVGLFPCIALARLIESELFGLSPWDPASWVGAAALLIVVAVLSGSLPAIRASKLDPIRALRWE